jgi:hypothetical protein
MGLESTKKFQKHFIIDLWKLTFEKQDNNASFNQVSKLAQTPQKDNPL